MNTSIFIMVYLLLKLFNIPLVYLLQESFNYNKHHHHHVPEGLGMLACSLILQMKLVPPSLPRSSYVSSSVWFVF